MQNRQTLDHLSYTIGPSTHPHFDMPPIVEIAAIDVQIIFISLTS
jgi:hypothetical protein